MLFLRQITPPAFKLGEISLFELSNLVHFPGQVNRALLLSLSELFNFFLLGKLNVVLLRVGSSCVDGDWTRNRKW